MATGKPPPYASYVFNTLNFAVIDQITLLLAKYATILNPVFSGVFTFSGSVFNALSATISAAVISTTGNVTCGGTLTSTGPVNLNNNVTIGAGYALNSTNLTMTGGYINFVQNNVQQAIIRQLSNVLQFACNTVETLIQFSWNGVNTHTFYPTGALTCTGTVTGSNITSTNSGDISSLQTAVTLLAPKANPVFTGTGIATTVTSTMLGYLQALTGDIQASLNLLAPKANPHFTGTVSTDSTLNVGGALVVTDFISSGGDLDAINITCSGSLTAANTVAGYTLNLTGPATSSGITLSSISGLITQTSLGYLSTITGDIMTLLALLAPKASPTFTTSLTAANPVFTGTGIATTVTSTMLGYLQALSGDLQASLNLLAPKASPTFTTSLTAANPVFTGSSLQARIFFDCKTQNYTTGASSGSGNRMELDAFLTRPQLMTSSFNLAGVAWLNTIECTGTFSITLSTVVPGQTTAILNNNLAGGGIITIIGSGNYLGVAYSGTLSIALNPGQAITVRGLNTIWYIS